MPLLEFGRASEGRRGRGFSARARRIGGFLLGASLFALLFNRLGCSAHRVGSPSMEPTLLPRREGRRADAVLVDRLVYGPRVPGTRLHLPSWNRPGRGEIVLVEDPRDPSRLLLLRVAGVPGDRVEIRRRRLVVTGRGDVPEDPGRFVRDVTFDAAVTPFDNLGPLVVPRDSYYLLGDNRDIAMDSRTFGAVPFSCVIGRAGFVYLPLSRLGRVR